MPSALGQVPQGQGFLCKWFVEGVLSGEVCKEVRKEGREQVRAWEEVGSGVVLAAVYCSVISKGALEHEKHQRIVLP